MVLLRRPLLLFIVFPSVSFALKLEDVLLNLAFLIGCQDSGMAYKFGLCGHFKRGLCNSKWLFYCVCSAEKIILAVKELRVLYNSWVFPVDFCGRFWKSTTRQPILNEICHVWIFHLNLCVSIAYLPLILLRVGLAGPMLWRVADHEKSRRTEVPRVAHECSHMARGSTTKPWIRKNKRKCFPSRRRDFQSSLQVYRPLY